ncbi:transcription repressor OFP17-like [Pyrus ussuriensis x Pyrus communis]|uniref:Transcription repressor OFP17-like n=1 Tax=Pyrus ussuriensis x Pyrus communis TaxID=2448454 RepID=A0A5N5H0U9_9ROSA|nr:transcription repressor OFP17-like [Pyrus ussuriensis x Pyrus communis]
MKLKASVALRSKLLKPCRNFLQIFRFKLKRPFFIRALHLRRSPYTQVKPDKKGPKKKSRLTSFLSTFYSPGKPKRMDRLAALKSLSEKGGDGNGITHYPSPVTPAYLKAMRGRAATSGHDEVQDACRSFENYLVEMIIEEGQVWDLMDVEELLYCWKNLKCPVFVDLVGRFYGELCKDLFSTTSDGSS